MSLQQFLVDLATNTDLKRRYAEDPEGTVAAAGLTAEERTAFASGDSQAVRTALGKPDNDSHSQTGFVRKGSVIVNSPDLSTRTVSTNSVLVPKKKLTKLERDAAAGGKLRKSAKKKAGKKR
jgi:hypothetical protein